MENACINNYYLNQNLNKFCSVPFILSMTFEMENEIN